MYEGAYVPEQSILFRHMGVSKSFFDAPSNANRSAGFAFEKAFVLSRA